MRSPAASSTSTPLCCLSSRDSGPCSRPSTPAWRRRAARRTSSPATSTAAPSSSRRGSRCGPARRPSRCSGASSRWSTSSCPGPSSCSPRAGWPPTGASPPPPRGGPARTCRSCRAPGTRMRSEVTMPTTTPPTTPRPPPWTYEEALAWLYGRQALGIKLGLEKVERLLRALGDPHLAYRTVHVAGTNGKGSVTRMRAKALQESGFRPGATTSPHLVSFTERIEVDGDPIAKDRVAAGLARVRDAVEPLDADGTPPTFFECVTALAFLHFKEAGVQWAVVETGMGGRLDATNVIQPRLTVITNIELDHEAHLGPTEIGRASCRE